MAREMAIEGNDFSERIRAEKANNIPFGQAPTTLLLCIQIHNIS